MTRRRLISKLYQRARRRTAVLRNVCVTCAKRAPAPGKRKCTECSEAFKKWKRRRTGAALCEF